MHVNITGASYLTRDTIESLDLDQCMGGIACRLNKEDRSPLRAGKGGGEGTPVKGKGPTVKEALDRPFPFYFSSRYLFFL